MRIKWDKGELKDFDKTHKTWFFIGLRLFYVFFFFFTSKRENGQSIHQIETMGMASKKTYWLKSKYKKKFLGI